MLRGNSGSGKSTLARALRAARPRGVAIVGQDQVRRELLHVHDEVDNTAVDLIDLTARFVLDRGLHAVLEGVFYSGIYGPMLSRLVADHRGISRCYRFDVPFAETLRRHATKPCAAEFGEPEMRRWWRDADPIDSLDEHSFGAELGVDEAVRQIVLDCGWS